MEEMVVVAKVVETAKVRVVVLDRVIRIRTVVSSFSRGSLDSLSYLRVACTPPMWSLYRHII